MHIYHFVYIYKCKVVPIQNLVTTSCNKHPVTNITIWKTQNSCYDVTNPSPKKRPRNKTQKHQKKHTHKGGPKIQHQNLQRNTISPHTNKFNSSLTTTTRTNPSQNNQHHDIIIHQPSTQSYGLNSQKPILRGSLSFITCNSHHKHQFSDKQPAKHQFSHKQPAKHQFSHKQPAKHQFSHKQPAKHQFSHKQ